MLQKLLAGQPRVRNGLRDDVPDLSEDRTSAGSCAGARATASAQPQAPTGATAPATDPLRRLITTVVTGHTRLSRQASWQSRRWSCFSDRDEAAREDRRGPLSDGGRERSTCFRVDVQQPHAWRLAQDATRRQMEPSAARKPATSNAGSPRQPHQTRRRRLPCRRGAHRATPVFGMLADSDSVSVWRRSVGTCFHCQRRPPGIRTSTSTGPA